MRVEVAKIRVFRSITLLLFGAFLLCHDASANSRFGTTRNEPSLGKQSKETTSQARRREEPSAPLSPFAPGTHNLSAGVGQVFLMGDLSDRYENAIGPELHYTYGVSDLFSFHSNFGYHTHSNGSLSVWNLSGGVRSNLMYFDQLVPFATVGMGFYSPSYTLDNNATVSALLFGMQLGTGIDLLVSNTVFFGSRLVYNTMFNASKTASDGSLRSLGGSYLSFMIHAGMTF